MMVHLLRGIGTKGRERTLTLKSTSHCSGPVYVAEEPSYLHPT